jgi:hypothetical protein
MKRIYEFPARDKKPADRLAVDLDLNPRILWA